MPYLGRPVTNAGQFEIIDDISSGFNGSETSFTLQVGGTDIQPDSANVTIVLDGVVQIPPTAYSITGSTLNFSEAPANGTGFHGVLAGQSQFIESGFITNTHISDSANISGSKINTDFSAQTVQAKIFSGMISSSVQISTDISGSLGSNAAIIRTLDRTTLSGSVTTVSSSLASRVTVNEGRVNQGVKTTDSPTFAGATITGTLTAQEVHTEFESASILFTSGSTQFGNSLDDNHVFSGSLLVTGSLVQLRGDSTKLRFSNDAGAERAFLQLNGTGLNIDTDSFIDFKPNNTFAARFDSNGRLGIGTNNPGNVLHLEFNDDSDVFTAARITDNSVSGILINNLDTGNGHGGMLKFANKGGDNHTAIAHSQDGNTDASLLFYSMDGGSLAEVMRVDHTHRLGIGNGSPSYKLDVTENAETNVVRFHNDGGDQNRDVMILQGGADAGPGNTRFITFNDGDGGAFGFIQGPADGATTGISFNTTADTALLTLSGSQVGIGTVDPQTGRLHIHNGDSGATSYVQFTQDGTGTSGTNGLLVGVNASEASIIYNGENTPLIFYTNASERVRITSAGYVGIGTNNPEGPFHVHALDGANYAGYTMTVKNLDTTNNQGNTLYVYGGNGSSDATLRVDTISNGTALVALGTGDVGIGDTVPDAKLTVNQGDSDTEAFTIKSSDVAQPFTDNHEADTYFAVQKYSATEGGANIRGLSEGERGLSFSHFGTNFDAPANGRGADKGMQFFAYDSSGAGIGPVNSGGTCFLFRAYRSAGMHTIFIVDEDGDLHADGSTSISGYDYAEMFEWEDGNPSSQDRVGYSVVFGSSGDKIRVASGSEEPIGVVSARPGVIGDNPMGWHGTWKTDEWDRKIPGLIPMVSWSYDFTRDTGEVIQKTYKIEIAQTGSFLSNIPSGSSERGVPYSGSIPSNANYYNKEVSQVSDDYDDTMDYTTRRSRKEWDTIGLMGKIKVRTGQATGSRWIKMKDVSDSIQLWLVK